MTAILKAQLRRSLRTVPTVEAQDAVSAALGSMLANQQAAARARAEHPDPEPEGFEPDEQIWTPGGGSYTTERPRPVGYEDGPELTSLPDDEGDDEDTEEEQRHGEALTEEQAIAADHFDEWTVDHEYREGDDE